MHRLIPRDIHDPLDRVSAAQFLSSLQTDRSFANGACITGDAPDQRLQGSVSHQVAMTEPAAHVAGDFQPIAQRPSGKCSSDILGYAIDDQQRSNLPSLSL